MAVDSETSIQESDIEEDEPDLPLGNRGSESFHSGLESQNHWMMRPRNVR